jgi:hypothetical protein
LRWIVTVLALGAQAATLPPPYPRDGATKMLDHRRVQVWDIAWLRQAYPVHHHVYDLVGVYYSPGERVIVSTTGERRLVTTAAWTTAFQRRGLTHSEEGVSDAPLRAVFVEIKDEPRPLASDASGLPPFPAGAGKQLVDNDRATLWEFVPPPATGGTVHLHRNDAVVVAFAAGKPKVSFVTRGTTHTDEGAAGAGRLYVFEIK